MFKLTTRQHTYINKGIIVEQRQGGFNVLRLEREVNEPESLAKRSCARVKDKWCVCTKLSWSVLSVYLCYYFNFLSNKYETLYKSKQLLNTEFVQICFWTSLFCIGNISLTALHIHIAATTVISMRIFKLTYTYL